MAELTPGRGIIPWDEIRTEGGTQPREELDLDTIDRYAEDMLKGDEFPPLRVFHDGKHYWLSDGFHRHFARKQANGKDPDTVGLETDVLIFIGTKRDAILDSLSANAVHGLPRSNEDKRHAVTTLLNDAEWSLLSDGMIAQYAKVSQPFVSKLRRTLPLIDNEPETVTQNVLSDEQVEQTAPAPPTERRGADNRVINTGKIGKKKSVTPAQMDIDVDEVSIRTSAPAQLAAAPGEWPEAEIALHLTIKPGKSSKRGVQMSGRAGGEGLPTFTTGLTLADFNPLPRPIVDLVAKLAKAATKVAAKKAAPTKSKAKKK